MGSLQRHNGQPGLGIAAFGGEHGGILRPGTGRRLQFTLGQHSTILADELNHKVLLLTAAQHIHREVVLLALLHGDAVPALVPEGVFRPQQGVVRIVLAERVLGGNLYGTLRVPGRCGFPLAAVLAVVFEVAVLDELGVEAAIGSIADVLEEDADKVGADGLLLRGVDGECGLEGRLGGKTAKRTVGEGVVVHALGRQAPVGGLLFEVLLNRGPVLQGNLEAVTLVEPAADGGRVAYPGIVTNLAGTVRGKVAEVRRGRCPPLTLGRLIVDVERAVGIGEHHRL